MGTDTKVRSCPRLTACLPQAFWVRISTKKRFASTCSPPPAGLGLWPQQTEMCEIATGRRPEVVSLSLEVSHPLLSS